MLETRANFSFMLIGLILIWLVGPVMRMLSDDIGTLTLYVVISLALCLGAWTLSKSRKFFLSAAAFLVGSIISSAVAYLTDSLLALSLVFVLEICFWSLCATFVGEHVLRADSTVDLNRISGAICIYLIAAIVWALLYTLVSVWFPEAFTGLADGAAASRFSELLYFSFVTLATLGYGDIAPVHPMVRWLAQAEAVFGQFYMAILVATLVGLRIARASRQ